MACDVLEMDACHILFDRPWQYDNKVIHDGFNNTYAFHWNGKKVVLLPNTSYTRTTIPLDPIPRQIVNHPTTVNQHKSLNTLLLTISSPKFLHETKTNPHLFAIMAMAQLKHTELSTLPISIQNILTKFKAI